MQSTPGMLPGLVRHHLVGCYGPCSLTALAVARACACRCTALGLSVGAVWRSRAGRLPCRVRCSAGVSGFPGGPTLCVWKPGSAVPLCVGLAARSVAPGPRHVGAPSRDPFPGPRGSAGLRPAGAGLCSGSVPLSGAAVSVACLVGLHVNSPSPRLTAGTLKVRVQKSKKGAK